RTRIPKRSSTSRLFAPWLVVRRCSKRDLPTRPVTGIDTKLTLASTSGAVREDGTGHPAGAIKARERFRPTYLVFGATDVLRPAKTPFARQSPSDVLTSKLPIAPA